MSLLEHTPKFETDSAVKLAAELYGIQANRQIIAKRARPKFLLESDSGEKFVLENC